MPNSATPPRYSTSRNGVTMRLSRLRVHVSSSRAGAHRDLRLVDDVPRARCPRAGTPDAFAAGGRAGRADERGERTEQQHVDERPKRDVEQAVRAAHEHVGVPARDRAHAQPRLRRAVVDRCVADCVVGHGWSLCWAPDGSCRRRDAGTRPRGRRGRTSAATVSGVPSATMRPCERNTTRSHTCSTSLMS